MMGLVPYNGEDTARRGSSADTVEVGSLPQVPNRLRLELGPPKPPWQGEINAVCPPSSLWHSAAAARADEASHQPLLIMSLANVP